MAWYSNRYVCPECHALWEDEWSCGCDDECPECECRHVSPVESIDLTVIVEQTGDRTWTVWRSPPDADEKPCYSLVGTLVAADPHGVTFVTAEKAR